VFVQDTRDCILDIISVIVSSINDLFANAMNFIGRSFDTTDFDSMRNAQLSHDDAKINLEYRLSQSL
jgi:hypothetical protein